MLARRRSRVFLLDTVDDRGVEFVEILKTIYPKADGLNEKDFDWLFDCPQTEQFLEWFCNTVGEENILTLTELENYEKLLVSGKPILEGEALEEVLKTCQQSPEKNGVLQDKETLALETLEQEVQQLKSQYACMAKRHNKLLIRAASLKQRRCFLSEMKEKASKELKEGHLKLELENFQSNDVLRQAGETAKELLYWYEESGGKQIRAPMVTADLRCDLEPEEILTKALKGYFPKVTPGIIGSMEEKTILGKKRQGRSWEELDTGSTENLTLERLLEDQSTLTYVNDSEDQKMTTGVLKSHILYEGQLASNSEPMFTQNALPEKMAQTKRETIRAQTQIVQHSYQELKQAENVQMYHLNLWTYQEKLWHMELAYMWSQMVVVMASTKVRGISSTLQWAGKTLKAIKENKVEQEKNELLFLIATFQEQLCVIQNEIDQAKKRLVPLLQSSAGLLCMPIVSGELDLEAVRLGHIESMQEETAGHLLDQLSHSELLRFLLTLEKKNIQNTANELEDTTTILNELQLKLQKWESCSDDYRFSIKKCPRTLIDPNDLTTLRLWEMLDKHSQEKQLFRTYETLASRASRLCQEVRMLQVQLATPFSQLPKLETEKKVMHNVMYSDSNQLMLHSQELSEPLEQLGITQAKLHQMLMDIQSDLKAKRKSLQSYFQKTERSLYLYFFNNPDYLKEMVEEAEKQIPPPLHV